MFASFAGSLSRIKKCCMAPRPHVTPELHVSSEDVTERIVPSGIRLVSSRIASLVHLTASPITFGKSRPTQLRRIGSFHDMTVPSVERLVLFVRYWICSLARRNRQPRILISAHHTQLIFLANPRCCTHITCTGQYTEGNTQDRVRPHVFRTREDTSFFVQPAERFKNTPQRLSPTRKCPGS